MCASNMMTEGVLNEMRRGLIVHVSPQGWRGEQSNVSQGDGRVTVATSSYFEGMTMPGRVYLGHVGSESVLNDMRSRPLPEGVILGHDGARTSNVCNYCV